MTKEDLLETLDYRDEQSVRHFQQQWPECDPLKEKASGKMTVL